MISQVLYKITWRVAPQTVFCSPIIPIQIKLIPKIASEPLKKQDFSFKITFYMKANASKADNISSQCHLFLCEEKLKFRWQGQGQEQRQGQGKKIKAWNKKEA